MRFDRVSLSIGLILALVALLAAACGGGPTVLAATPTPGDATSKVSVVPPDGRFAFETPNSNWTPVMIGGDQGVMLSKALADRKSVMLLLGAGNAAFEERVFRMVKAAVPQIAVVARARATLDALLEERGEIPYRVTLEPAGPDVLGRPYFLPKEHPLHTEWLSKKKALKGADGLLTVRRIQVDSQRLREIRDRRRGGCDELLLAVNASVTAAESYFEPYIDAVDEAFAASYRRHLEKAYSFWKDELANARTVVAPGSNDARCLDGYEAFLEHYAACVEGSCQVSPRLVLAAGGLVAMDNGPFAALPERCQDTGLRDLGSEMKQLAARAVADVLPHLGGGWNSELIRFGALARLADGITELCVPRHRRFSVQDLETARGSLSEFLDQLQRLDANGEWIQASGLERTAGSGPVAVLARVQPRGRDVISDAASLLEQLRRLARCDEGPERLLQASLIDVGSSEVVFMGIFFEEQLLCQGLPPGQP